MNKSIDTQPWYQQFWPWFVFALPATAVVAGIVTIFIAVKHADSLVEDDYYKEGLGINTNLRQENLARELGVTGKLVISEDKVRVVLSMNRNKESEVLKPSMLMVKFYHPFSARHDFELPLQREVDDGVYAQSFQGMSTGYWRVEISPLYETGKDGSTSVWRLTQRLNYTEIESSFDVN